uniref:Uncharacterized protein n=1 Tax=Meloidogyne hapla TaxID=6305 RepID=A0A1I8BE36_MELHA
MSSAFEIVLKNYNSLSASEKEASKKYLPFLLKCAIDGESSSSSFSSSFSSDTDDYSSELSFRDYIKSQQDTIILQKQKKVNCSSSSGISSSSTNTTSTTSTSNIPLPKTISSSSSSSSSGISSASSKITTNSANIRLPKKIFSSSFLSKIPIYQKFLPNISSSSSSSSSSSISDAISSTPSEIIQQPKISPLSSIKLNPQHSNKNKKRIPPKRQRFKKNNHNRYNQHLNNHNRYNQHLQNNHNQHLQKSTQKQYTQKKFESWRPTPPLNSSWRNNNSSKIYNYINNSTVHFHQN